MSIWPSTVSLVFFRFVSWNFHRCCRTVIEGCWPNLVVIDAHAQNLELLLFYGQTVVFRWHPYFSSGFSVFWTLSTKLFPQHTVIINFQYWKFFQDSVYFWYFFLIGGFWLSGKNDILQNVTETFVFVIIPLKWHENKVLLLQFVFLWFFVMKIGKLRSRDRFYWPLCRINEFPQNPPARYEVLEVAR